VRGIRALVLAATSVVFALGIIYESRAMLPSQPSSSVSSCTRQAWPSLSCDANGAAADQSLSLDEWRAVVIAGPLVPCGERDGHGARMILVGRGSARPLTLCPLRG